MDAKPLVSIIIPTYKRTVDFLSRAVQSVINQTYENVEVIVIDDSPSTFEGREAIAEYMSKMVNDRVIYYQNPKNIGGSLARNKGIELAQGEFISFLDDDDEYLSEKIEKQVAFMLSENCDLSFANMRMFNNAGKVVDFREYHDIWSYDNEELLKYHLMRHLTGTPTFMFKADKLREIGGFEDAKMGQEFYLMMKSIQCGLVIRYFDSCDIKVYKHEGEAITNGKNKISGENNLYAYKQQFFDKLKASQKRYIRFRHWAVMVVAYKRNKMYYMMPIAAFRAFVSSPLDLFREVFKYIKKI